MLFIFVDLSDLCVQPLWHKKSRHRVPDFYCPIFIPLPPSVKFTFYGIYFSFASILLICFGISFNGICSDFFYIPNPLYDIIRTVTPPMTDDKHNVLSLVNGIRLCGEEIRKGIVIQRISKKMKQIFKNRTNRWLVLDQSFFAMFITFSLIELANVGAGVIDGLIVSNCLDAEAMAAAGIAHPIFSISGIFGGLFATGMQTLCVRELGRGDIRAFNRLFSATMILGTAFSAVLTALLLIGASPLAMLLGATGKGASLLGPAAQYLRGVGIGLPGLIMAGVLASAIQMDSGRKRVMTGALLYSALNVLLDLVAIQLDLGMFGIGLATATAMYVQIVYLLLHFIRKDRMPTGQHSANI